MPSAPPKHGHLWTFLRRAFALRCPECGLSPIFRPLREVKDLYDYFTPLDGCPHCGYAYEREDGYFLLSIWVLNYGIVSVVGLIAGTYIQSHYHPDVFSPMWLWLCPLPVLSMLLVRHSKSVFLAIDHYIDPHVKPTSNDAADHESSYHP